MTQGRKSKTVLALGCALVALMVGALLAPGFAAAQAAGDEYNSAIPGARHSGGGGPGGPQASTAGSTSDSGTPVLLIGLAGIAAVCTGLAAWRLRNRSDDDGPGKVGPGATGATSETQ